MSALEQLIKWQYSHKSHAVSIYHENGYGAHHGWQVKLTGYPFGTVEVCEWDLMTEDDYDDEWPGLEAVILKALDTVNNYGK